MVSKTLLLCVGLAILPAAACGQSENALPATSSEPVKRAEFEQLTRQVKLLSDNIGRLTQQLPAGASDENTAPTNSGVHGDTQATEPLDASSQSGLAPTPYEIAAKIRQMDEQVASLKTRVEVVDEVQRNHQTQLGQIAAQAQDGSYYLQFNTKNSAGREEVQRALQEAAPQEGILIINNRMGTEQFLYVEGDGYRIQANETRRIPIRRGTIATHLPGQEQVLWTINAPDYQQTIDIRPRTSTPSPIHAVPYVARAIYVDPWTGASYVVNQ